VPHGTAGPVWALAVPGSASPKCGWGQQNDNTERQSRSRFDPPRTARLAPPESSRRVGRSPAGASAAVVIGVSATSKEVPRVQFLVHRAGSLRAGAVRVRAGGAGRVLGRLPGPDPCRIHPGSSPVHRVVRAARPPSLRRPPDRYRVLRPRSRTTVARRLCTICGFYRYAEEEGVLAHSPAVHIRRPRVDDESHVVGS
jgi:hypothetical protein